MNMHMNSIQAGEPPVSERAISCLVDRPKLKTMSMADVRDLREGVETTAEILCGLQCQPRYWNDDMTHTPAGEILSDILEFLNAYRDACVQVARAAEPTEHDEIEARAWALIRTETEYKDDILGLVALVNTEAGKVIESKRKQGARR